MRAGLARVLEFYTPQLSEKLYSNVGISVTFHGRVRVCV